MIVDLSIHDPLHIIFSGISTAAESSTIVDGIQPEIGASL